MKGQRIGYVRVSSFDQNPDRQLEQAQVDKVFTDKASVPDRGHLSGVIVAKPTSVPFQSRILTNPRANHEQRDQPPLRLQTELR